MKNKQLFACTTCQMTDVIYLDGTETVNQVISMMDKEHKKTCPQCQSGGKFRVVLKTEEAQQKRAADSLKAEAICQPKKNYRKVSLPAKSG